MTVDETPISPAATGTQASNATIANSTPKDPKATMVNAAAENLFHDGKLDQAMEVGDPNSFESFMQSNPLDGEKYLKTVVEVTGIADRTIIYKAFNQSKKSNRDFDVNNAIEWILTMSENSKTGERTRRKTPHPVTSNPVSNAGFTAPIQPPNSPTSNSNRFKATASAADNKPSLVDLTDSSNNKDVDADLEKAIQLSLQEVKRPVENFGVSQEDQDVSRALEASLLENQNKRSGMMIDYVDPLNPHDRERHGMWPVGLKNVGQTCWFSAVIQSLFYIPAFRSLVLNFPPPPKMEEDKIDTFERRKKIVEFMLELRHLFALMVASQRKYVDPTKAVEILRGSIGSLQQNKDLFNIGTNIQQDVTEFTHIVIDWVEEAFKNEINKPQQQDGGEGEAMDADCEKENNEEKEIPENPETNANPMARLFYGKVLLEGNINGDAFSKEEAFGQWNIPVNNFVNVHESIENSLAPEALDAPAVENENSGGGSQERWFVRLPPVLFLELQRYQYNRERKMAEKTHNRLEFPEQIFVDRYMSNNKVIVRRKREEVRALKEKRASLKSRLEKFTNYGESKLELPSILQKTLEFASGSARVNIPQTKEPPSVASLAASNLMQVDSPCGSPKMTPATSLSNIAGPHPELTDEAMDVEMTSEDNKESTDPPNGCDTNEAVVEQTEPCPRHVTEAELCVLQTCLSRWKEEVDQDVNNLNTAIKEIDSQIELMYSEEALMKHEYQLHAVMVHEGSIDSGHYWAYVLDHQRKVWLKFNDNTVNEASWDELSKESMGGHSNTSAYSLVYIDRSKPELLMDIAWAGIIGSSRECASVEAMEALAVSLPQDLAQFVSDDNKHFQEEISKWDHEQENKNQLQELGTQTNDNETANTGAGDTNDVQVVEEKLTYVNQHAKLSTSITIRAFRMVESIIVEKNSETALRTALEKVIQHHCALNKENPPPSGNWNKPELLPKQDPRLDSFINYLHRNGETKNMPLVELAVLEQFSIAGLELNQKNVISFSSAAKKILNDRRAKSREYAEALRQWHQAYHCFRRSVHCFVEGLDAMKSSKFQESLDLLTESYHFTLKASEVPVSGAAKTLKDGVIIVYLCKVLPEVNRALIDQFRMGENLNEVVKGVQIFIVPVLIILQARVDKGSTQQNYAGIDAQTLEEVRNDWCALVGETDVSSEASTVISDVIPMILLDAPSISDAAQKPSKNRECVDQALDLALSNRYTEVISHLQSPKTPLQPTNVNRTEPQTTQQCEP